MRCSTLFIVASAALALGACAAAPNAAPSGGLDANRAYFAGGDLSYVNEMDDCGATFRVNDVERDPYELFADAGMNLVRLRLWVNPDWTDYSTLDDVTRSIRRAKAAGMQVLLDLHYSDDWADPQKQTIPAEWAELIDDVDQLSEVVYAYTRDVLTTLGDQGLTPELVQVGNETNTEVMRPADTPGYPIDWARNVALLNAGIKAVRDMAGRYDIDSAVMLHIAQPENAEPWFAAAAEHGLVDFDYIGLSYYPNWSDKTMPELGETIARLRATYDAEVIVVETSYPWTLEGADEAGNILGEASLHEGYPATRSGQRRFMVDLTRTVLENDGVGIVYWEPAWVSTTCSTRWGQGSHWENATLFDFENGNEILPAADYLRLLNPKR